MKHSAMLKFTILVLVVVALFLGGCVKVNNQDVQAVDYRASVRFVNLANMPASMAVSIDKAAAAATVSYQNASSYLNLPAGARFFSFAFGGTTDTLHAALTHDTQYSLYSVYEASNSDQARTYMLLAERMDYPSTVPYPANTQVVRFINASSDTAATVAGGLTCHLMYGTKDTTSLPLAFGDVSTYFQVATSGAAKYMIVGAKNDTLIPATAVGASSGRYSVVFSGSKKTSSWIAKVFQEN